MISNVAKLEFKIAEKIFQFFCDPNAPTAEVKEALSQMIAFVTTIENNAKAKAAAEAETKPEEKQDEQTSSSD